MRIDSIIGIQYNQSMKESIEQQLRRYIQRDGRTLYGLQVESGVDRGVLSRFVSGKRTITLRTAGSIARALRLELKPVNGKAR